MDSFIEGSCPSCGQELRVTAFVNRLACPHCGEELVLTPDKRIFLANPISKYSESAGRAPRPSEPVGTGAQADMDRYLLIPNNRRVKMAESQRRQTSLGMTTQKINRRKKESQQLFNVGVGVFGLGIVLSALTLARLLIGEGAWIDLGLSVLGILALIPLGTYLIISSLLVGRLLRKQEQELEKESSHL